MCVNSVEFSTGEIKINTGVGRIQKKKIIIMIIKFDKCK